ncbi:hypothetical protein IW492_05375 [Enterococcus sp. BWB1-3]|uniref:hypothetical protein n=1 Tax=unclassified Enterococcus TaxID=2608891 RepID=UPI001921B6BA|nr:MULTISPECIES: hypothetical protein [unclassified Enterococcus]MBL1228664.1 hypothetical protein [Enterococcus sp. BWB1-3]MCB5952735.1 hypothetical protein [Enterococcus sp. BWT-B8]MCB5953650.1 hypothetical protein [Enterococcus sp. CWB-B31]
MIHAIVALGDLLGKNDYFADISITDFQLTLICLNSLCKPFEQTISLNSII